MTFFGDCKIHAILLTGEKNIEIIKKRHTETDFLLFCCFFSDIRRRNDLNENVREM